MKKLLYVLFAVTLFTACSSDDPAPYVDPSNPLVGTWKHENRTIPAGMSYSYTTYTKDFKMTCIDEYKQEDGSWKKYTIYENLPYTIKDNTYTFNNGKKIVTIRFKVEGNSLTTTQQYNGEEFVYIFYRQ